MKPEEEEESQLFGQLVVRNKLATREQVEECMLLQHTLEEKGSLDRLGDIMVAKGYLTENQLRLVLQAQQRISPVSGQRIPGYEILAKLGQGTMGSVYKARQISMDRLVAIKVLSQHYSRNQEFVNQFIREARAAAQLSHQNIVRAIDVGNFNNLYYFVMELVEGESAEQRLRREGALPEREALEIIAQICRALQHSHNLGVIHRNVKPNNILLSHTGLAKLCDLGLSHVTPRPSSAGGGEGRGAGTSAYFSIEQAGGQTDLDARSDIYSLGATFYHLVTGRLPFENESGLRDKARLLSASVTPPEQRNPKIQRSTSALIQKMMARETEHRHASTKEVEEDIQSLLQNKPMLHTPVPFKPPPAAAPARETVEKTLVETSGHTGGSTILFVPKQNAGNPDTTPTSKPARALSPASLTFITGNEKPKKFQISQPVTLVGRLAECDIQVPESWFSRKHFVIYARNGRYEIEDLHSTNGTKLNGREISKAALQFGDQILVYNTLILLERETGEPR